MFSCVVIVHGYWFYSVLLCILCLMFCYFGVMINDDDDDDDDRYKGMGKGKERTATGKEGGEGRKENRGRRGETAR